MNRSAIITELENSLNEFQQLVSSFDEKQINESPSEGSWSAGQVAQHIIMANSEFGEVLNGPVKNIERAPYEKLQKIKDLFLDFTTEIKSPDFIIPQDRQYQKELLLSALENIKGGVSKAIWDLDLTQTCLAFELPVYGHLTRLEAIYFVIYHTRRHANQLKKIKSRYPAN